MSDNLREIIKQEYIKCATDPSHFMNKYCYIQHPKRGRIQFNLYPFQGKVLRLWRDNSYNIVLKSRQLGISTLSAGYALWLMLFHKDKNVLCIATKQETAKNMVTKVKFMYENLPSWLKIPAEENNKLTVRLTNGSQIKAVSAASDAGRSEAVSLLIIDEAAFIEGIDEIWASAQQTLATGGGAIVLSTPYGTGNWFHKTWVAAEEQNQDNIFLPIKLPWYVHPERDEVWRKNQDALLGDPRLAAQECDCDFSTSGDVAFYEEYRRFYTETYLKDPIERRGADKNLWIWEYPDYTRSYMVVADVARGDGKDFSAFHVIDIETNTQVAEYKSQIGTKEFGILLVGISSEYNNALLIIDNAGIGWNTVQTVIDRNYPNLYYSPKNDAGTAESYFGTYQDTSNMTPGLSINLRTRPIMINKFIEYFNDKSVVFHSKRLMEEMKVFVWKNGRAEAQQGYNDDLVMSMAMAMYIRDTALKLKQQGLDLTRSVLNNITSVRPGAYNSNAAMIGGNPYNVKMGGQQEDLRWLFK